MFKMKFSTPFYVFQSEFFKLMTNADEMDFSIYDSALSLEEINKSLKQCDKVMYGILTDVSGTPTSAKTDTIVWKMTVRIELITNYKGRKPIAEMITKIGEVATAYLDIFDANLSGRGYSVVRMELGQSVIGSAITDGAIVWQNGCITLNYYLSQLTED